MAVPIAVSILLGHFLDGRLGTGFFWTLTLLGVGVSVAGVEVFLALRQVLSKGQSGSSDKKPGHQER
jgi:hypothetical protein